MTELDLPATTLQAAATALDAGDSRQALHSLAAIPEGAAVSTEKLRILRGVAHFVEGDRAGAEREFASALRGALENAVICWKNLAGLAFQANRLSEALGHVEHYRQWRPFDKESVLLHAAVLTELKRRSEAREILDGFLEAFPADAEVQMARIECFIGEGGWLEALYAIGRYVRDHGDSKLPRIHRTSCYLNLGLTAAAEKTCAEFLPELGSEDGGGYFLAGTLHLFRHEYAAARQLLQVALQCPGHPDDAAFSLGLAALADGDFTEGYQRYSLRKTLYPVTHMHGVPVWSGGDVSGQRLLIHWEQGIGDSIQYMRYIPLLAQRGLCMVFNAQPELTKLLRHTREEVDVDEVRIDASSFDCQLHLLDLPLLYGASSVKDIPAEVPYLFADPDLVAVWRERLADLRGLKIGLAWAGNPEHVVDHFRSSALADLLPLAEVPEVSLVSLQLGKPAGECAYLVDDLPILDLAHEIRDLADTAAIIENLDLVIAVDTAVAHLAGALGKPIWVMLPAWGTDWRWELAPEDSPWYPTARLFRQSAPGDWRGVAGRMRDVLWGDDVRLTSPAYSAAQKWRIDGRLPDDDEALCWSRNLQDFDVDWAVRFAEVIGRERSCASLLKALAVTHPSHPAVALAQARYLAASGAMPAAEAVWNKYADMGMLSANDWLCRAATAGRVEGWNGALGVIETALRAGKVMPTLLLEQGRALAALGRSEEAMAVFSQAASLVPRPVMSLYYLGVECINRGMFVDAVAHLQHSVMLNPQNGDAWVAIANFARRLDLPWLSVEILSNLGSVRCGREASFLMAETLAMDGREVEAERLLDAVDEQSLSDAELAAYLLALKTVERWNEHDAVLDRWFRRGIKDTNNLLTYAWRKLQCGDYSAGWPAYRQAITGKPTSIPPWNGEPLTGKRILVYQDQGFGDLIQFFPLVRELLALGPIVTLAVSPDMVELIKRQGLDVSVVSLKNVDWNDPRFVFSVAQMHLPHLLDVRLDLPRHEEPILYAPSSCVPHWDARLAQENRFKVGVVWAGNPLYVNDAFRSTRLRDWAVLAEIERVAWYNLQKDVASNQAIGTPDFSFENLAADCDDWVKTASLVRQLDLVIAVDTGVAHLAAALGVPTWILLPPRVTDFRWQMDRADCPWYASVRLFRRSMHERWVDVVDRVGGELRELVLTRGPGEH